ncbi:MAG TPA: hypothetical protein VG407_06675 [Caulobacteraceae bacterium]|jgi:hypothetical protein|nr:hypothetical protein [Caulobacteraceae bacterium]
MSSGKGRLGLDREEITAAETESAQALHDAAGRVELWLSKVDAARLQARDEVGAEELEPEDLKPYKKGFWPFRKTIDPMADRTRSILADLEAAAEGRPDASAAHAEGRAPRPSNVVSPAEPLVKAAAINK